MQYIRPIVHPELRERLGPPHVEPVQTCTGGVRGGNVGDILVDTHRGKARSGVAGHALSRRVAGGGRDSVGRKKLICFPAYPNEKVVRLKLHRIFSLEPKSCH